MRALALTRHVRSSQVGWVSGAQRNATHRSALASIKSPRCFEIPGLTLTARDREQRRAGYEDRPGSPVLVRIETPFGQSRAGAREEV